MMKTLIWIWTEFFQPLCFPQAWFSWKHVSTVIKDFGRKLRRIFIVVKFLTWRCPSLLMCDIRLNCRRNWVSFLLYFKVDITKLQTNRKTSTAFWAKVWRPTIRHREPTHPSHVRRRPSLYLACAGTCPLLRDCDRLQRFAPPVESISPATEIEVGGEECWCTAKCKRALLHLTNIFAKRISIDSEMLRSLLRFETNEALLYGIFCVSFSGKYNDNIRTGLHFERTVALANACCPKICVI